MDTKMIGNKIAEARKKVNISQAQLATHLFISPQAVGKWERGESMPDMVTFNRIAEILEVDLNYFSEKFQSQPQEKISVKLSEKRQEEVSAQKQNKLNGWDMSLGNWVDADFSGLKNLNDKFSSSNMQRCKFNNSDLSGLQLKMNNVDSCDFSGADFSNSQVKGSNLLNNLFKSCLLKETEFFESNIDRCNFAQSNLNGTKFTKSFIYGCEVSGADFTEVVIKSGGFTGIERSKVLEKNTMLNVVWCRTSFIDSHIADLVFTGTIDDCYFENCKFTRVIFQDATLVNTFFKNNKNLKRVQFTRCKADRMTFEFLKQGNADLTGVILSSPKN